MSPLRLNAVDMTLVGLAFLADRPLGSVDDQIEVEVEGSFDHGWLALPCQIRLVLGPNHQQLDDDAQWLHGVKFSGLSEDARRFVQRLVTEVDSPLN